MSSCANASEGNAGAGTLALFSHSRAHTLLLLEFDSQGAPITISNLHIEEGDLLSDKKRLIVY
jgi:hypothetical protein